MGARHADEQPVTSEPVRGGYPEPWTLALPGAERLARFRRGLAPAPPLSRLTGSRPTGFGDGTGDAEMPASGWLANSAGLLSGGTLAILADVAFGVAVETQVAAATPYTTAELSLTFLRPARPGATLTAHGQAIHVGRSLGLAEVFVLDPRGERMIAHGTSRISILPRVDGLPEPPPEDLRDTPPDAGPRDTPPDAGPPDTPPAAGSLDPPAEPGSPDPYLRPPPEAAILPQAVWAELRGREILERQLRGELPAPPIHHLTGIEPTEVSEGTATLRMPASEWLNSPARRLQGGTIAMLAEQAMIIAALTTSPAGTAIAGVDLKANFLRPVQGDGGELVAEARVEHAGRTLAISRARVTNAEGKPVLLATGTAMYLPGRPANLGPEIELSGG
ncbi:MAG: hotdog fold thioesterase [Solirubrobacterales bacterium]|nr:hotdog fold thioesterase [Solirubrobacterales bacterium]